MDWLREIRRAACGGLLALAPAVAAADALVLDAFTEALPPNPCLPVTTQPVVFIGPYCDAAACPPGAWAACATPFAIQDGLPGVLAGIRREARVMNWQDEATHAGIDPLARVAWAEFGGVTESIFQLDYGSPGDPYPGPSSLNLDLESRGGVAIRFTLGGDITPERFLSVNVEFLSDAEVTPRPSATARVTVTAPGEVVLPFDAFERWLGFSFTSVDDIQIWFDTCDLVADPDCLQPVAPRGFTVGPIEFVGGPTAAKPASWGRIKTLYR